MAASEQRVHATAYFGVNDKGVRHTIEQHEGGKQGDPFLPLQFSLGIRRFNSSWSLVNPSSRSWTTCTFCLHPNGLVCCTICSTLQERAASSCTGKTRTWNCARDRPVDMEDLGPDVWNPEGIKILGTPVGYPEFLSTFVEQRLWWSKSKNCGTSSLRCRT